ncbi:MAG TPA: hypothetical protein VGS12_08560 [Caulobacteraceae bacterium]|nr:hypothetical protein [Caulobacteraceae bacterium]
MEQEVFIGGWTRAKLRERSQNERHAVWKRAKSLHSAEGNQLARAIERLGLPYAEPEPLADNDPLMSRMREVAASPEARSAAIEATLDGLPALAGIDSLMHASVGEAYRLNPAAAPSARRLTDELMVSLGYVAAGEKDLPSRCIARTGTFWKKA